MKGKKLTYRYAKIVDGFNMPVEVRINSGDKIILKPTAQWQELKMEDQVKSFSVDPDYYVLYKKAD